MYMLRWYHIHKPLLPLLSLMQHIQPIQPTYPPLSYPTSVTPPVYALFIHLVHRFSAAVLRLGSTVEAAGYREAVVAVVVVSMVCSVLVQRRQRGGEVEEKEKEEGKGEGEGDGDRDGEDERLSSKQHTALSAYMTVVTLTLLCLLAVLLLLNYALGACLFLIIFPSLYHMTYIFHCTALSTPSITATVSITGDKGSIGGIGDTLCERAEMDADASLLVERSVIGITADKREKRKKRGRYGKVVARILLAIIALVYSPIVLLLLR